MEYNVNTYATYTELEQAIVRIVCYVFDTCAEAATLAQNKLRTLASSSHLKLTSSTKIAILLYTVMSWLHVIVQSDRAHDVL
jgi:hypothetical protein